MNHIKPLPSASSANTATQSGMPRRKFLGLAGTAAVFTVVPRHVLGGPGQIAPSEKITLAGIGMGAQGRVNLAEFLTFPELQVVAVCDVNREGPGYLSWYWGNGKEIRTGGREPARREIEAYYAEHKPSGTYKGCRAYADYRELLEREDVDAVMIATPDHTHAAIAMAALKRGKHVYCEKPLAWSLDETRRVTEAARQAKVATQLGNQGQADKAARVTIELVEDGVVGPVHEVQVWSGPRFWAHAPWEGRPPETRPVPEGMDWDLWLGPAPVRPYHPAYHPWSWRNWWDFGTGLLGDLGCHKLSTVFKALKLGHPTAVEASSTKLNPETYPLGVIARFEFPARGGLPPVVLDWYDGGLRPPRPKGIDPDTPINEPLYVGEKGLLLGAEIFPEPKQDLVKGLPRRLPLSPGHRKEWVNACRGGPPAGSDFVNHAGVLTEMCLLGNVAVRCQGTRLLWDGPNLKVTNHPPANQYLRREYRPGWSL
jgi:predicted dehydrogenase